MTSAMPSTLDAGVLRLRRFVAEDADQVLDAVRESGTALSIYETWARPPFSHTDAVEYVGWWTAGWEDRTSCFYAVAKDQRLIGACGLFGLDPDAGEASLGFWIRSSQTGRGHASLAAHHLADAAFASLGLRRIVMRVATGNAASLRVCSKIGAIEDRRVPGGLELDGDRHDAIVLSLWSEVDEQSGSTIAP